MAAKLSVREKFAKALDIFATAESERIEAVVADVMNAIDEAKLCAPHIDAPSFKDDVLLGALHSVQITRIALKDARKAEAPAELADSLINQIKVAQTALLKRYQLQRPDDWATGVANPTFEPAG